MVAGRVHVEDTLENEFITKIKAAFNKVLFQIEQNLHHNFFY